MQIEIEELKSAKTNGSFWGSVGRRGMTGGEINIKLANDNVYKTSLQDFVFYIVHRSYGKGLTINIKKYEEGI
jgi:hypothetical protein